MVGVTDAQIHVTYPYINPGKALIQILYSKHYYESLHFFTTVNVLDVAKIWYNIIFRKGQFLFSLGLSRIIAVFFLKLLLYIIILKSKNVTFIQHTLSF